MAWGSTQPLTNEYQVNFLEGKGGRYVGLTTLPPSCLEIWEPQPPGNLWACTSDVPVDRQNGHVSGVPRGGVWGVQTPPPRNSEDIGGVLDRTSKKNQRLDFLL